MYEALFPGRVDLGIGRAPGGNLLTAKAHERGGVPGRGPLSHAGAGAGRLPRRHAAARVSVPHGEGDAGRATTSPEVWLLGSSDYSGALAAYLGLRFAFAHFINAHGGDAVMRAYREQTSALPTASAGLALCSRCS